MQCGRAIIVMIRGMSLRVGDDSVHVTVSVDVAMVQHADGLGASAFVRAADSSLYAVKGASHFGYVFNA